MLIVIELLINRKTSKSGVKSLNLKLITSLWKDSKTEGATYVNP